MVTVLRTNLATDPRGTTAPPWSFSAGTGGSFTEALVTGASDGPLLPDGTRASTYVRYTITAMKSAGAHGPYYRQETGVDLVAGGSLAAAVYVRPSVPVAAPGGAITLRSGGVTVGSSTSLEGPSWAAGQWARVGAIDPAESASTGVQIWLQVPASQVDPVGTTYDVTCVLLQPGAATVEPYFDGSTPAGPVRPDGSRLVYGWTGAANASASTESLTDAVITAELITSAGSPPPVQIVLTGIPNGAEYVVTGSTGAGSSWPVPGGTGVGDGGQIVLVDNRSALNTPVTYSVLVGGVTYSADPLIVEHDGQAVLQSLDGLTSVDFVWLSNGLPREPQINAVTFNVPGRRRPPVRYAPGGDGGGELLIRADRANNTEINDLLLSGRPILVRTDGTMRDWPAVELILLTAAPSRLWEAVEGGQMSTQRVWNLSFLYVDDPEPSRVLSAWTWDDFNQAALVSFPTWDAFNTLFAGQTWADFNTTAWGQYQ